MARKTIKPKEEIPPAELSDVTNGEASKPDEDKKKKKEKKKKEKANVVSVIQLFRYSDKKDYALLTVGFIAALVTGGSMPAMSIIFGGLSNTFIAAQSSNLGQAGADSPTITTTTVQPEGSPEQIGLAEFESKATTYSIQYSILGVVMLVAGYLQTACWLTTCERQVNRIRREFMYAILRQDIAWFDEHQSGTLTASLADNLDRIREGIGDKLGILIQNVAQFVIGVIIAFCFSWKLTLVMMSLSPLMIASNYFMAKVITTHTRREQKNYAMAGAIAEEVLSCIRTVIAFNGQKYEVDRYDTALDKGRKSGVMKSIYIGAGLCVMFVTQFCSFALAFWYGSTLIVTNDIERGDVFVVFFSILMGSTALGNAGPQLATVAASRGAAAAIYEIIDRKPDIDAYSEEGKKLKDTKGKIEFKDVHFAYPTRKDIKIINGLSFTANEGETVALVGPSGCGKSTVVSLLLRQYNQLSGKIMIDGEEINTLNVNWLRNYIGVVAQEPILFEATVQENIEYGNSEVTHPEMVNACRQSNAHHFIAKLPEKYNTMVGQRGSQLSGGQKQRIAIARALVREPRILLLDEATSALDAESEFIVQQALDTASKGRTTLVIAHRLSTIQNADKIIALDKGEIREMGTHHELLQLKGLYYDLVMAQQMQDVTDQAAATVPEEKSQLDAMRKNPLPKMVRLKSRQEQKKLFIKSSTDDEAESGAIIDTLIGMTGDFEKETIMRKTSMGIGAPDPSYFDDVDIFPIARPRGDSVASELSDMRDLATMQRRPSMLSRGSSNVDLLVKERLKLELEEEGAAPSNFFTIVGHCKHEWHYLTIGLINAFIRGFIQPAFSFFFSAIFDTYSLTGQELKDGTTFWSLMLVVLGIVNGVTGFGVAALFGIAGENITKRMRLDVWSNILRQDVNYFDDPKHSVGKICTRLATDAPNVKTAVDFRFGMVLSSVISVLGGIILALIFGWQLALLVIGLFPLMLIGNYLRMQTAHGSLQKDNELLEKSGKIASEAIENVATVQYLTQEKSFYESFCNFLDSPYKAALKQAHIQAISFAFSVAFTFFLFAASFRFGAFLVTQGYMEPTDVFRVFFAISMTGQMVGMAASYVPEYIKARMSAGLLFRMASVEPKIDSCATTGLKPEISGNLVFSDVHFTYPTRSRAPILTGLTLEVEHGKTVALVGPSGCGKSTVVSLLERFYDPIDGHIQLDDFALQSVNVPHLRSQIALVSQEPILFGTSIKENITYGLENVTEDRVIEACKLANIHTFVEGLPDSYNTDVGEKGTQLSGGQKQRIAIARALVRDPKILLLDEATSALDTESEKIVQEAIDRAREGRTSIVIAHRLSTVQNSDMIAVIKHGTVVEQGTHAELVNMKGLYYSLMQKQTLHVD